MMKRKIDENVRFMAVLLCIILAWSLRLFPFKFGGWNQATLAFSYRYGFIQRAFIGSLLDAVSTVFGIPLGSMRYIHGIVATSAFTCTILFLAYKSQTKKDLDSVVRNFLKWMAVLFFVGPGWNSFYKNFGITDTWQALVTVAGIYLLFCNKDKFFAAVMLLAVTGELVHPAYVFMYFNLIIFAFGYRLWIAEGRKARVFLWMFLTVVTDSLLFIYMVFFSRVKEGVRLEDVMLRIATMTNKTVQEWSNIESLIKKMYLREGTSSSRWTSTIIGNWGLLLIVTIIVFGPFIYEVFKYWRDIVASSKVRTPEKSKLYMLIPFGILTAIPLYLKLEDYGRHTYSVFFYEFAVIWVLNIIGDKNAVEATHNFMGRLAGHKMYYVFLMFYAALLGPIEQNLINPVVSLIEQTGWKILALVGIM